MRSIPHVRFDIAVRRGALVPIPLGETPRTEFRRRAFPLDPKIGPHNRYALLNLYALARVGNGEKAAVRMFQHIRERLSLEPCARKCAAVPALNVGWMVPSVNPEAPPGTVQCWYCGCQPSNGSGA